jgi:hypothetical protein
VPGLYPSKNVREGIKDGLAVAVYPNPSAGAFTVELPALEGAVEYSITDLMGRVVGKGIIQCSKFKTQLAAESGVYLMTIRSKEEKAVIRLVRE